MLKQAELYNFTTFAEAAEAGTHKAMTKTALTDNLRFNLKFTSIVHSLTPPIPRFLGKSWGGRR
jgi:hypothetical protein